MASVSSTLSCEGQEHRISWHSGRVVLDDHPDPLLEIALCALGGPWPSCIAVLSVVRGRFDPVGTWPVWTSPLPRAAGPELLPNAWARLLAARRSSTGSDNRAIEGAEDRWAMAVLSLVDPALRRRLALDAVVGRCRRTYVGPGHAFDASTLRRGFSRRDGRGPIAESILLSSIGAPPGANLRWVLQSSGDARISRLADQPTG